LIRKKISSVERHSQNGKDVGCATSGGYGWHIGKSLALVNTGLHQIGTELDIEILGELFKATVIEESPFDPQNEKLRA
jgi:dimethylglycine dehydrogenase